VRRINDDDRTRPPYLRCALVGLGGLFFGVTGVR
jgi:hypothetical protein